MSFRAAINCIDIFLDRSIMEYSMDKASVDALLEWAQSYSFPKELRLSDSEFIFDVPRFVQSNVSEINIHYPDSFFEPCIVRLYRLKEVIENKG